MKPLGLLGGFSPEGTAFFTQYLHEETRRHRGPRTSARLLSSVFCASDVRNLCAEGDWLHIESRLVEAAGKLESSGAEGILIDSSALHVVAPPLTEHMSVPFFHLIDEVARELARQGIRCAGLLGTRYRSEEKVWVDRLQKLVGIDTVMPPQEDREHIAEIIDSELVYGYAEEAARVDFLRTLKLLRRQRAGAMILVAPELSLLVDPGYPEFQILDGARVHAEAAVRWALGLPDRDLPGAPCIFAHEDPTN
jgi:aspartate racemase